MKKEVSYIFIAAILFGLITTGGTFFVQKGLSLFEICIYRMFFICFLLFPFLIYNHDYFPKKEMLKFFILYGLLGAVLELAEIGGIALGTPVAIVAFLLYSQSIWTTIFGKLIFKELITKRKIIAVIMALLGVFFLLRLDQFNSLGSFTGIILSLFAGILLSLWVIMGRKSGLDQKHFLTTTFTTAFFSLLWLLLFWPVASLFISDLKLIRLSLDFSLTDWFYLLIFALFSAVFSHLLFYRGIQKVEASLAGIILLLEPVSATILAAIFFSQAIGWNVFVGGALILFSNYLVFNENSLNSQ